MNMKRYNRVLTIAGSDSGGGAGIQADIKTIEACGCYAESAITAITVQNTLGVEAVHPVPVEIIGGQIDAVLSDIGADAVKIGMLHSREVVLCVREALKRNNARNIVLDPVMVSTSGHRLIEEDAVEALRSELVPYADVITPNIPEAEILLRCGSGNAGLKLELQDELPDAARMLSECCGGVSVLLKAGHLSEEQVVDVFYDSKTGQCHKLPSVRVQTRNTHGTGCTMSSAFASMLALGKTLPEAAEGAKRFINEAIIAGAEYSIGHGFGPVHHLYKYWK